MRGLSSNWKRGRWEDAYLPEMAEVEKVAMFITLTTSCLPLVRIARDKRAKTNFQLCLMGAIRLHLAQ